MFKDLKKSLQSNFNKLQKNNLFYVNVDKDEIYKQYLDGFSPELRQEHTCNCCKSFLRQFAGIVAIVDNKVVSIWDNLTIPDKYKQSVKNLKTYIHSLPIHSTFFNGYKNCGTDKNLDVKDNIIWEHFYFELDRKFVKSEASIASINGTNTNNKNVFKRALDELTKESVELVLELIDQNSLYRGKEFENTLKSFQKLQKEYSKIKPAQRDNFCWAKSLETSAVILSIRNSSIGTLLIDLSSGMELDTAVTRFEKVVAPTNYKRPVALVTSRMIEDAKKKLSELDLLDSLDRRYATSRDITVDNLLFTDKSSGAKDVFDEVSKETKVDIKKLTKIEEISIQDFIDKVLPKTKSMEILLENKHLPNFVSLITSQNNTNKLFKWDNDFSWSYTGGITDSIKEKVKAAGGNVDGVLRTSLSWNNYDDLDIHCVDPNGEEIYFGHKNSRSGGVLDVDMNAGYGTSRTPVENIVWANQNIMKEGIYTVKVHNFNARETSGQGYILQIECNGEIFDFEESNNPRNQKYGLCINFNWSRTNGITLNKDVKSKTVSKEKWGLKTNTFVKVKQSMLSPNYWGNKVGNKHYMFILENCVSDEKPRPFFNEFLKEELNSHRKVLEIIGSKIKIEEDKNQLSGLGFSETKKDSVIVRVDGSFKRTLKINF